MTALNAGIFTLAGVLLVALIALLVARSSQPALPKDGVIARIYRVRFVYFVVLGLVLLASLALTLPRAPYLSARNTVTPDVRIAATGWMWTWRFDAISGEGVRIEPQDLTVPAGKLIEFDVTSGDVNHGFGIYDDQGHILTQVQAMPGYTNQLRYRFPAPGVYHILCMEFCGYAHHLMMTTIHAE
ncbi:MAG: cytochrome C oxidase subunit II [Gammaproteobacteria bacterium]